MQGRQIGVFREVSPSLPALRILLTKATVTKQWTINTAGMSVGDHFQAGAGEMAQPLGAHTALA